MRFFLIVALFLLPIVANADMSRDELQKRLKDYERENQEAAMSLKPLIDKLKKILADSPDTARTAPTDNQVEEKK